MNFARGNLSKEGKPIMAESLNKFVKNGWIDSRLSGPPKLKRIMARFVTLMIPMRLELVGSIFLCYEPGF